MVEEVYQHAAGTGLNATEQKQDTPILRTSNIPATETVSSGVDYEEDVIKEVMAPQFLVSDSGRGELKLKKPEKPEGEKKNSNKQKRKGNKEKKNKKKKKNPCEDEFKNFCIHGECQYLEILQAVRCKCLPNYFGERCAERFLKTHRSDNDAASNSFAALASIVGVVVGLALLCFAIIVIVIIVQVRKKCPKYDEKEERKKLRYENGSLKSSNGV
ncbi:hypothetical protein JD844_002402 [Phrynosoma platyrhinos]|uniref:EGF-like domain-containing protein n=1 Tax=Phrynosoma platyrhinos TaxID=52577 RepID=A0ABQ7TC80_PHRPL|nr:hypothetical protein JD844_002402 [Phrynosoma platyrhinos]